MLRAANDLEAQFIILDRNESGWLFSPFDPFLVIFGHFGSNGDLPVGSGSRSARNPAAELQYGFRLWSEIREVRDLEPTIKSLLTQNAQNGPKMGRKPKKINHFHFDRG